MPCTTPISDHAVLRYMQRQLGIDVEAIREDLAHHFDSPHSRKPLKFAAGTRCRITAGEGLIGCFNGGVMTTCYPKRSGDRRTAPGPSTGL